jgi:signal transduction histidine kinase
MTELIDGVDSQEQGDTAAGRMLCHDLKQPVAAILMLASNTAALPPEELSEDVRRRLQQIEGQAHELVELIDSTLSPSISGVSSPADLDATLADVVRRVRLTYTGRVVLLPGAAGARVLPGHVLVRRVFGNVLDNAIRAAGKAGVVCVSTQRASAHVIVDVDDDGAGWGQTVPGHGLGLSFVTQIMQMYGGSISAQGLVQGGTRVRLEFPLSPEAG